MTVQSNPRRVASQALTRLPNPDMATPPRPWPALPAEARKQIAQSFARLLLRMRSNHALTKAGEDAESVG